jgi:large subunit ribosomal protein L10
MILKKEIPQWKKSAVDDLANLMENYKVLGLIDLTNMPDNLIQQIRKQLREKALIRMAKKSIVLRALEKYQKKSKKKNLVDFGKNILGQSSLVFTNEDPFELKRLFDENRMKRFAREGDIAQENIVIYAGDTRLPPGQVITELHLVLKLPTRIQNDSIFVTADKVTHQKGDVISLKEAMVLRKLNIKPIEVNIKFYCAWENGEIIPDSLLNLNVKEIEQKFSLATLQALNIAFELPFIIDEKIDDYIKKALLNARIIYLQIFEEIALEAKKEIEKRVEEEPEPSKEEEVPEGLGNLFG